MLQLHPSVCMCTGVWWCEDVYVGVPVRDVKLGGGALKAFWIRLMENQMFPGSLLPHLNSLCGAPLFWCVPKRPAWYLSATLEKYTHLSTSFICDWVLTSCFLRKKKKIECVWLEMRKSDLFTNLFHLLQKCYRLKRWQTTVIISSYLQNTVHFLWKWTNLISGDCFLFTSFNKSICVQLYMTDVPSEKITGVKLSVKRDVLPFFLTTNQLIKSI